MNDLEKSPSLEAKRSWSVPEPQSLVPPVGGASPPNWHIPMLESGVNRPDHGDLNAQVPRPPKRSGTLGNQLQGTAETRELGSLTRSVAPRRTVEMRS